MQAYANYVLNILWSIFFENLIVVVEGLLSRTFCRTCYENSRTFLKQAISSARKLSAKYLRVLAVMVKDEFLIFHIPSIPKVLTAL